MSKKTETAPVPEAEKTAAAAKVDKPQEKVAVAYLGPTIKGAAVSGTVYIGGIPATLQEKIKEIPMLQSLVVPVSEFAATQRSIETDGTAQNIIYTSVQDALNA